MGRRVRLRGSALAVALLVVLPVALPAVVAEEGTEPGPLQVLVVSTQHWVGENTLLVELFDEHTTPLAGGGVPAQLTLAGPGGERLESVPTTLERFAISGRPLYVARVALPAVGRWTMEATATLDGRTLRGSGGFEVLPDDGTPALGSAVPGGATPTLLEARNLMAAISSDPEPVSAFYMTSVDRALADGQPFVFVLDSYAFQPNEACGGALGVIHDIFFEYPALTVVHAEPWHTTTLEGQLVLDPPGGPARLTAWSEAWGVTEPPWVFVVDADGRLVAKFSGVFGTDELRSAIGAVAGRRAPA